MDTQTARAQYLENGYDPIPLQPGSKLPTSKNWQNKPTITQWKNVQADSNIGLRAGDGKAFIDCDDKNQPGTTENITRWMDGLGYHEGDYPLVRTPSGGAHIYTTLTSDLMNSKKNLLPSMGKGEFRYGPGAQVCAWPSVIDAGAYVLVSGDIARLPELDIDDIKQLININDEPKPQKRMSRTAFAIANGRKPDKYTSNSEAEAGLILSLIDSGYTYAEIKQDVFNSYPCLGHYIQKHAAKGSVEGERWLYKTYQEMLKYSQRESPARLKIHQLLRQAQSQAWSNANRKQVYLSHLQIAHKAGRPEYAASVRDLALGAGVHKDTAGNQTRRLIGENLLSVKTAGNTLSATVYVLNLGHSHTLLSALRECPKFAVHDAFRNGGGKHARNRLGRRAGEIYELIFENPLTLAEIVKATGARKETVTNALDKMHAFHNFGTGEVIEMVSKDGDKWYSNLVDLDVIAAILRTYGATGRQKRGYQDERKAHRRRLELGTLAKGLKK